MMLAYAPALQPVTSTSSSAGSCSWSHLMLAHAFCAPLCLRVRSATAMSHEQRTRAMAARGGCTVIVPDHEVVLVLDDGVAPVHVAGAVCHDQPRVRVRRRHVAPALRPSGDVHGT